MQRQHGSILIAETISPLTRLIGHRLQSGRYRDRLVVRLSHPDKLFDWLQSSEALCAFVEIDEQSVVPRALDSMITAGTAPPFPIFLISQDARQAISIAKRGAGYYDGLTLEEACGAGLPKIVEMGERIFDLTLLRNASNVRANANTRLLTLVAHEIKAPLETLRLTQSAMLAMNLDANSRKLATQSERAIAYMCEYIDNFIEHARIEKGRANPSTDLFCIEGLIGEVLDLLYPKADAKGVKLTPNTGAVKSFDAYGDKKRLRQILVNIVNNAIRYTDEGEVAIKVSASDGLEFEVSDTGVGMSRRRLNEVFDGAASGAAAEAPVSTDQSGLGIGVPLCRKLVSLLNGTITADSKLGVGTTVRIQVPLQMLAKTQRKRASN